MTNPNEAIGTNAGYNGRTTPNALNDNLAAFSRGIVSGWACSPKSGMIVQIGGDGSTRDVAIAEDNAGNRTTINNRSGQPVDITIPASPSTGNRIDYIIAYVANPQAGIGADDVDFPSQCGIIPVSGTVASSPSGPDAATIKSAITADGADGSTAYYIRLAYVYVGQGVSTIGSGSIYQGSKASMNATISSGSIGTTQLASYAVTTAKIANNAVNQTKIDFSSVAPKLFKTTSMPAVNYTTVSTSWSAVNIGSAVNITGLDTSRTYVVIATTSFTESTGGAGEFRLAATGATVAQTNNYTQGGLQCVSYTLPPIKPDSSGKIVLQRAFSGLAGQVRMDALNVVLLTVA